MKSKIPLKCSLELILYGMIIMKSNPFPKFASEAVAAPKEQATCYSAVPA